MKLELLSLTVGYFRSFGKPQTLRLDTPGLWFIRGWNEVEPKLGANGAGKSSLFSALTWCIYGTTADGLRNTDIKPWNNKNTPFVELQLRVDGEGHTILREARTNGVKIDEREAGPEEPARLVGLPFSVFVNTILQAQGAPLFLDLSPKDKMQLFTDVLNLERWEERSKTASQTVRELENLQSEMLGEKTGLTAALTQAEDLFNKARASSEEWEAARRDRTKELAAELAELESSLALRERELGDAELAADSAGTEAKALRKGLDALMEKITEHERAYARQKATWELTLNQIGKAKQELEDVGAGDECVHCGQPLKGTGLATHQKNLRAKIKELEAQAKKQKPEASAGAELYKALDKDKTATLSFERAEEAASLTVRRLRPLVAEKQTRITLLKTEKNNNSEQRNPYSEQIQTLRRKKGQLEGELERLEIDLEKADVKLVQTRFWVKGFKDVQLYVIEEVLQELEIAANMMLAEVGLTDWQLKFAVEKETKSGTIQRGLNVLVLSPYNASAVKWEVWSGGEGQRLRVVGALALSQVLLNHAGIEPNIEILDEPTRHIGGNGARDLGLFLSERAKQLGRTIFLADHLVREGAHFTGTILVTKTKVGSVISG